MIALGAPWPTWTTEHIPTNNRPHLNLNNRSPEGQNLLTCLDDAQRRDEGATMNDGVLASRSAEL